jgi:hypothetical protein
VDSPRTEKCTEFFLGHEEAPEHGHVQLDGGAVHGFQLAGSDLSLSFAGQRDNIVLDDVDANVVKVVVREVGDIPLGFLQGMAFDLMHRALVWGRSAAPPGRGCRSRPAGRR